jgi:hypothetical protein
LIIAGERLFRNTKAERGESMNTMLRVSGLPQESNQASASRMSTKACTQRTRYKSTQEKVLRNSSFDSSYIFDEETRI